MRKVTAKKVLRKARATAKKIVRTARKTAKKIIRSARRTAKKLRQKKRVSHKRRAQSSVDLYNIDTQITYAVDALSRHSPTVAQNFGSLILQYVREMRRMGHRITLNEFYNYLVEINYPDDDYLDELAQLIAPDYD